MLRYLDVILMLAAAPIMVLVGVPAAGYGVGVGAWIVLRGLGSVIDRYPLTLGEVVQLVALRVGYRFTRVALLVFAIVLAQKIARPHGGLAALLVIVFGLTVQLGAAVIHRGEQGPRVGGVSARDRSA